MADTGRSSTGVVLARKTLIAAAGLTVTGGGGGGFDPLADITWKAAFWADDPSWTNPGDGNPVTSWRDAGTEGVDPTQATASIKPTFRSSTASLNNRATVEFDAGDNLVSTNWGSSITGISGIFIVFDLDATGTVQLFDGNDSGNRRGMYLDGGSWRLFCGTVQAGGTNDTNAHYADMKVGTTTSNLDDLNIDGASVISGVNSGTNNMDGIVIGSNYTGGGKIDGHIAFLGIKDGDWAGSELSDLRTWAASYYGI